MDTREPTGDPATEPVPGISAGSGPSTAASGVKNEVKTLLHDAKEETSRLADMARERASESADARKEAAAGKMDTVAEVLRDAGQRLQEQEAGFGRYAAGAAEQVDRLAHYLRRSDLGGMVRDAETFARRHPELFLGVAFLGGIFAARFLKSSPREEIAPEPGASAAYASPPASGTSYGSAYGAGYGYPTAAAPVPGPTAVPAAFNTPPLGGPGRAPGAGGGDL
ncbi:MAG TPA: hypothetical protein VFO85_02555 [Vicinamibacteria bacterium]|nr:hypothetical protein [Vicinamibacteria bacterium]